MPALQHVHHSFSFHAVLTMRSGLRRVISVASMGIDERQRFSTPKRTGKRLLSTPALFHHFWHLNHTRYERDDQQKASARELGRRRRPRSYRTTEGAIEWQRYIIT